MRSLAFSHIRNFTWRPNVTPLSSPVSMLFLVVAYLALIGILSWLIRRPLKVPMVVPALHNLLLCLASALMFLGCAYESYQTCKTSNSVSWLWCLPPRTKMQVGLCTCTPVCPLQAGASSQHSIGAALVRETGTPSHDCCCRAHSTSGATCTTSASTGSSWTLFS